MKKQNIVGYGLGERVPILADLIQENTNFKLIGFVDDLGSNIRFKKDEYKVIGKSKDLKKIFKKYSKNIFLGFAGIKNTSRFRSSYKKFKKIGFKFPNLIHKKSFVSKSATLGDAVQICARVIVNPKAVIGNNVILNAGCVIEHDCIIEDNVQIGSGAVLGGFVTVKKNSFIGLGTRVINGITIGEKSIIGAGSVVINRFPKNSIVAGIPAKKIKSK